MGYIRRDDVRGAWIGGSLYCESCIKGDEWNDVKEENLVLESNMDEEDFYFCDECKNQL